MEQNSDPLDVAVALAQAMGPSSSDNVHPSNRPPSSSADSTHCNNIVKDDLWSSIISPHASGVHSLDMALFPLDQTPTQQQTLPATPSELLDPLDPNSCLSFIYPEQSPSETPATLGLSHFVVDKAWQYQQQQQQFPPTVSQSSLGYPSHHPTASNNLFMPPTPPVDSPGQAISSLQQMPVWFGLDFTQINESYMAPEPSTPPNDPLMMPRYHPRTNSAPGLLNSTSFSSISTSANISRAGGGGGGGAAAASTSTTTVATAAAAGRRRSTPSSRPCRRRTSSQPSVASVVSLSSHEPVAHAINGIEHITFLYSHDRLVKEYTVRTDVESVSVDDIPLDFRMVNAIYPRANVGREEYDGNRWNYETSCNSLGWKLCWLNQEQLCGRRGLIQRAVDSYRNRHAHMRSRRVTRQEKVANGTLRRRRAKRV